MATAKRKSQGLARAVPAPARTARAARTEPAKKRRAVGDGNGSERTVTAERPLLEVPDRPRIETPVPRLAEIATRVEAVRGKTADGLARDSRGKYVYCVIKSTEPLRFGRLGIGAEPAEVHTVNYRSIAAVVSDTPIEVHEPTRENVLAHERVNETVMRNHTVIPMSFGTVFKTREDIVELLRSAFDAFNDVLVKMEDKLEFGLKVLWNPETVLAAIEREDEDVRRLKSEISSQKGSTYFARMQYGRLVDAALQSRSERFVSDIFEQLRDVSVASRANKPIGDKMIMNAAFLVSRDKEQAFDARVKEIGAKYDKLTFKYTGPWPPYNFVNIRLKLERAKEGQP